MRLSKVQKALKETGIEYTYKESQGCGDIFFKYNGKNYSVSEYVGNHGKTPIGIYTGIGNMGKFGKQDLIVERIKNMDF